MSQLKIKYVKVTAIKLREDAQRQKLAGVEDLMNSIERIGLIHPIVLDDKFTLIAGGCRLEAYKRLSETDKKYAEIPAIFLADLSAKEKQIIELEENIKRSDLPWQDTALTIKRINDMLIELGECANSQERADYVGMTKPTYLRWLTVGEAVAAKHERVLAAPNIMAAYNIIEREKARRHDNEMNNLMDHLIRGDSVEERQQELPFQTDDLDLPATLKPSGEAKPNAKPQVVCNLDFIPWAENYSGPRFNLIHCDFPYGINHGKSAQGGAQDRWDAYEDSPDVYFALLRALLTHRDNIMLHSCHVIFWLSARFSMEEATRNMIAKLAPDLSVDEYKLIWHKTDNKGIIRDVNKTPRHIYETALFINRGNRPIIKAVGDVYGAPTRKSEALHISEKPVPVLKHFMQLCVDEYTEMLDPTCGSGSALRAAHGLGAKRVLGLEINPEYADSAQREFDQQLAIESLRNT